MSITLRNFRATGFDSAPSELDFVHYGGKQSAYSSRLNKRD